MASRTAKASAATAKLTTLLTTTTSSPSKVPPLAPLPTKPSVFPTHLDAPPGTLDPRVHAICSILTNVPQIEIDATLSHSGIPALPEIVEFVLRYSYSNPPGAVRFFRWAAASNPHTPRVWNLMVDLLGKNGLFEAMWDAIRSMRHEPSNPLSVETFASAFGSYCAVGKVKEAVMTFDVMDRYGITQDVFSVNSLLSAICSLDGRVSDAADFFEKAKLKILPDADSYAILLEGWERECNVARAKDTFWEMIVGLGWDPRNVSAHDAYLSTLVRGGQAEEFKFLHVMKNKGCLPGMKFFAKALDILFQQNDTHNAVILWDTMVGSGGLVPNTIMYNAMIALYCLKHDFTAIWCLLDEMPLQGAFPDSVTYNTIFECLLKNKKAQEVATFLNEMRKNDFALSPSNCVAAVRMFFDEYDPEAALQVWTLVLEEHLPSRDECAIELLLGLQDLGRMKEVWKYAKDMLDMGIELNSTTMVKLKGAFQKAGRMNLFDDIERKLASR